MTRNGNYAGPHFRLPQTGEKGSVATLMALFLMAPSVPVSRFHLGSFSSFGWIPILLNGFVLDAS